MDDYEITTNNDNETLPSSVVNEEGRPVTLQGKNPSFINHADNINYHTHVEIKKEDSQKEPHHFWATLSKPIKTALFVGIPVLILILSIVGILSYRNSKYSTLMDTANNKLKNGNYEDALDLFFQAENMANTNDKRVEAHCFQGDCYMIMGILDSNNSSEVSSSNSIVESKYDMAIKIYNDILSDDKNRSTEYYYDAAAGLSNCYYFLGYPVDDAKWTAAISAMEEKLNSINYNTHNGSVFFQIAKLDNSLGLYYCYALRSSVKNMRNKELSQKALKHLTEFSKIRHYVQSYRGIRDYDSDIYFVATASDTLIIGSFSSEQPYECLSSVIEICETTLSDVKDSTFDVDETQLFHLKYSLGKAYYYLSFTLTEKEKKNALIKAHSILSSILTTDDTVTDGLLTDAGYYCAFTGECTTKDIEQILSNIRIHQESLAVKTSLSMKNRIHSIMNALSTCAFITVCYDEKEDAMNLGLELSEKVIQKKDHMDNETEKSAQLYYDYFHGENVELDLEEFMNNSLFE